MKLCSNFIKVITDNSVSNNDASSSSNVNNATVDNSNVDNSNVNTGNDSSTTTNTHNTTNNYYTNNSGQSNDQVVPQPIVIQVQNDDDDDVAADKNGTTIKEENTDTGNAISNIKIDAQGVDCVFEVVDGAYNISITARQTETIPDTVTPVATYTPIIEEQSVGQSVDWLQVIQIVLLGAVLLCLIWKPKNQ